MTAFVKSIDGSGWLSVARTDPDFRRMGAALFLQSSIANHAKRRGVRTLRLWTEANNKPSILAVQKGGYRMVCQASHISAKIRKRGRLPEVEVIRIGSKQLLASILRDSYVSKMNGYIGYRWQIVKFDAKLLKTLVRTKEIIRANASILVLTKPDRVFGDLWSSLTLLQGPPQASLQLSRKVLRKLGAERVGAYIPYSASLLRAARRAGFAVDSWGKHCLVFEKRI